ncbi:hypothetical protein MJT46_003362 [Ovis ammon polii x Ovis aries]|nr:hypothetical protein MJT46_003362 [Ovis ammon polii x Ovis aries]
MLLSEAGRTQTGGFRGSWKGLTCLLVYWREDRSRSSLTHCVFLHDKNSFSAGAVPLRAFPEMLQTGSCEEEFLALLDTDISDWHIQLKSIRKPKPNKVWDFSHLEMYRSVAKTGYLCDVVNMWALNLWLSEHLQQPAFETMRVSILERFVREIVNWISHASHKYSALKCGLGQQNLSDGVSQTAIGYQSLKLDFNFLLGKFHMYIALAFISAMMLLSLCKFMHTLREQPSTDSKVYRSPPSGFCPLKSELKLYFDIETDHCTGWRVMSGSQQGAFSPSIIGKTSQSSHPMLSSLHMKESPCILNVNTKSLSSMHPRN